MHRAAVRGIRPYRGGMRFRKLGSSDLEVSEISLGSWLTFSGGVEFDQTRACTEAAFEVGINFFDTANVYGRGGRVGMGRDPLGPAPRLLHPRDEGLGPDVRRPGRPRPVGGA